MTQNNYDYFSKTEGAGHTATLLFTPVESEQAFRPCYCYIFSGTLGTKRKGKGHIKSGPLMPVPATCLHKISIKCMKMNSI